jgi:hypothetical protein
VEGIFRVSAVQSDVKTLKKRFEDAQNKEIDLSNEQIHTVAGCLKLFLMEPEESILTAELYDAFLEAIGK